MKKRIKINHRLSSLFLLLLFLVVSSGAKGNITEPFSGGQSYGSSLPSEVQKQSIRSEVSIQATADWWDEGPPTDGGGGGGAVGVPLETAVFPLLIAAGIYLLVMKRRKHQESL